MRAERGRTPEPEPVEPTGLVGRKVLVRFVNWPISQATYVYEGCDESGHWVRRKDGVQRQFPREVVQEVIPVDGGEVDEGRY